MMRISFTSTSTRWASAQVVAAVAARVGSVRPPACLANVLRACGVDGRPEPFQRIYGPLSVGAGLIAGGLHLGNAVLRHRVGKVGDAFSIAS
jgi:hypothetical protein